MHNLKIKNKQQTDFTVVSNRFIDEYLVASNGEFVKIYIFLLRSLGTARLPASIAEIADIFAHTETDILRALRYWEKQGLLDIKADTDGYITEISLLDLPSSSASDRPAAIAASADAAVNSQIPAAYTAAASQTAQAVSGISPQDMSSQGQVLADMTVPSQGQTVSGISPQAQAASGTPSQATPGLVSGSSAAKPAAELRPKAERPMSVTADKMKALQGNEEIQQLLFIAEQYLGKTLSPTETNTILYFYDELHMSADLIEYLIEYCVSKGSKGIRYIQTVGLSWFDEGITTAEEAKRSSNLYNRSYYTILNAFGIKGRGPAEAEIVLMNTWQKEYGFTMEIILEACRRTISQTHQPSFQYADKILFRWKKNAVKHLKDIEALDKQHQEEKARKEQKPKSASTNKFNNFNQRDYDFDELEQQLLNSK